MSAESISSTVPAQWSRHARGAASGAAAGRVIGGVGGVGGVGASVVLTARPARVADLPALAQLLVRSSPRTRLGWYGRGGGVLPLAQQEAWLAEPGGLVVEEARGRVVAVAALRPATCTGQDDPIASSIEMLVHDAWQRRGIGTALVRSLAAASHAQGRTELQVSPGVDGAAADRLLHALAAHLGGRPRLQRHEHGRCPRVHLSDRTVTALVAATATSAISVTPATPATTLTTSWRLAVRPAAAVHAR